MKNNHIKIMSIDSIYLEILKRETQYLDKRKSDLKFSIKSDLGKLQELKTKYSNMVFSTLDQLEDSCKPYAFAVGYYSSGCTGGWSVAGEIMRAYRIRKVNPDFPSLTLDQASSHIDILEHIKSIYQDILYKIKIERLQKTYQHSIDTYNLLKEHTNKNVKSYIDGSFNKLLPGIKDNYLVEITQQVNSGIIYSLPSRYLFHGAKTVVNLEPLTQYIDKQLANCNYVSFKYKPILMDLLITA